MRAHLARFTQPSRDDQRGSALTLALVMVFVVAVIVTAIIGYAGSGLRANHTIADLGEKQYALDSAVETAIGNLRLNPDLCSVTDAPPVRVLEIPAVDDQPEIRVDCDRTNEQTTSGSPSPGSLTPENAIETTGRRSHYPSHEGEYNSTVSSFFSGVDTVEPGVDFLPSINGFGIFSPGCFILCFKETSDAEIGGKVRSNSNVVVRNPLADTKLSTSDPANLGFTVRERCEVSNGSILITPDCVDVPADAPSVIDPNLLDSVHNDPAQQWPSRGDWEAAHVGFPPQRDVPQCTTPGVLPTLVIFEPGWYADANALNQLFRECANDDGTGKDYWFKPGVYYFDFRDGPGEPDGEAQSNSQYCGIGLDNNPLDPRNRAQMEADPAFVHQWCIRGRYASDGTETEYRPRVVGGEPDNWTPNPVIALLRASTAASDNFTNPDAARAIGGASATMTWGAHANAMRPQDAAGDFTNPTGALVMNDGNVAERNLASETLSQYPQGSESPGSPNFSNHAGGRQPNDGSTATTSAGAATLQPPIAPGGSNSVSSQASGAADFDDLGDRGVIDASNPNDDPDSSDATWGWTDSGGLAASADLGSPTGTMGDFNNRDEAYVINSSSFSGYARFASSCSASGCTQGQLVLTSYDLPAGAIPTSVSVVTRHRENTTNSNVAVLRILALDSNNVPIPGCVIDLKQLGKVTSSFATDTYSFPPGCIDTAATINNARLSYEVQGAGTSGTRNFDLDGIRLDVSYTGAVRSLQLPPIADISPASNDAIMSARLNVAHISSANSNPRLSFTGPSIPQPCTQALSGSQTTFTPQQFDLVVILTACGVSQDAMATAINDLVVTYMANLNASGTATAKVDGVKIDNFVHSRKRSLRLFNMQAPIGDGVVENVEVKIRHREQTASAFERRLVVTPGVGAPCTFSVDPGPNTTWVEQTIPVTGTCLDSVEKINGASFRYEVWRSTTSGTVTAELDGIEVRTTLRPTRSLVLKTFTPTVSGTINNAILSFRHWKTGGDANAWLTVRPGDGSAPCLNEQMTPPDGEAAATVLTRDLSACLNSPAKLNGATVEYKARRAGASASTVFFDGAEIAVNAVDLPEQSVVLSGFVTNDEMFDEAAILSNIEVRVAHNSPDTNPQLVVTPSGGPACLTAPITPGVASLTVPPNCIANVAQLVGASFEYRVTGVPGATASLDGLEIRATYTKRPTFPEACKPHEPGVQWIFGGDSHVYIPDATVELCAGRSPGVAGQPKYTAQQIAFYGVPPVPTMVSLAPPTNPDGYTNPDGAKTIGDLQMANISVTNTTRKSIKLTGFNAPTVAPGLSIKNVTARISHATQTITSPRVKFENGVSPACERDLTNFSSDVEYEEVNLTTECVGFDTSSAALANLAVTVSVARNSSGSARQQRVDGVELDVTLKADAGASVFVPQHGCITAYPNYGNGWNAPDCAVMKWDSTEIIASAFGASFPDPCSNSADDNGARDCLPNAQVSIKGTVYAPGAAISIDDMGRRVEDGPAGCNNGEGVRCYLGVNYPILNRGVIARTLRFAALKVTGGSEPFAGNEPDQNDREVILTAYMCPCDPLPPARVTAEATIPIAIGAPVDIRKWDAK